MRDDMARVIVERPRIPDRNAGKHRKARSGSPEDQPFQEGMRRPHLLKGRGKMLNENLQPLRRYLERQVGRPWNRIYAEIAANLRIDNAVQQHVRDHLRDFVAVQPRRQNHGWRGRGGGTLWWQPLYVDPVTGLLCRTDRLPEEKARRRTARRKRNAVPERIPVADDRELRRLRGFWYEVQMAPLPEPQYRPCQEMQKRPLKPYHRSSPIAEVDVTVRRLVTRAILDVATNTLVEAGPAIDEWAAWRDYRLANPDRRYAVAKRMLSRRELRRHGLSNEAPDDIGRAPGTMPASRPVRSAGLTRQ